MDSDTSMIERLFSKYIFVLFWSIQVGVLAGVTFTFTSFDLSRNWGPFSGIFAAILGISILSVILSWLYAYRYFAQYLVPVFFLGKQIDDPEILAKRVFFAFLMKRSIQFVIIAIAFRCMVSVFDLILVGLLY